MKAIHNLSLGALVASSLFILAGCPGKEKPAALAPDASPPVFGEGKNTDVATFLEGKWSPDTGTDAETAEKFGISAEEADSADGSRYWEFNKDGTMIYTRTGSSDKIHGKWFPNAKGIEVRYETFNETPLEKHRENLKKAAEVGTPAAITMEMAFDQTYSMLEAMHYFELSEDKKKLDFKEPGADAGSFSGLLGAGGFTLVRMKG